MRRIGAAPDSLRGREAGAREPRKARRVHLAAHFPCLAVSRFLAFSPAKMNNPQPRAWFLAMRQAVDREKMNLWGFTVDSDSHRLRFWLKHEERKKGADVGPLMTRTYHLLRLYLALRVKQDQSAVVPYHADPISGPCINSRYLAATPALTASLLNVSNPVSLPVPVFVHSCRPLRSPSPSPDNQHLRRPARPFFHSFDFITIQTNTGLPLHAQDRFTLAIPSNNRRIL